MALDKIGVALLGLGTVGSGVHKIITSHREDISRKVGIPVEIRSILEKDASRAESAGADPSLFTGDFDAILADPQVQIVVEVLGGMEPARTFILKALEAGKHVVTANKEVMAREGEALLGAADAKGVDLFFEASVGGGIPIIRPLKQCLAGNKISRVMGIVNGTTNYILTRMTEEGTSFDEALSDARESGYAERDASADVEGKDAASKIAILASIAFNSRVTASDVYTEGIASVSAQDIIYAREVGYVIKLIALAKEEDGELEVRVHPTMIPQEHPLASVRGVYNAIFVEGDAVGPVMFYGQGAGSMAAGSAIVGDVIDIARDLRAGRTGRIGCTCYEHKPIRGIESISTSYYLLIEVTDRPGVLAKIATAFGDNGVSIASVIQKGPQGAKAELMFLTHRVTEENLQRALATIRGLDVVEEVSNVIRVEGRDDG